MIEKYCSECGNKLELKALDNEGIIPYCKRCNEFKFPKYSVAVSMIVINEENNKILLIQQYNKPVYILVAGYVNKGESLEEALKREIKEETGMEVDLSLINPFMMIKYYTKNYFNSGKNRCNKIYYFVINTDNLINLKETNYTKEEKEGNYTVRYINLSDVEEELIDNANKYPRNKNIVYEMLQVISEYINQNR